MVFIKKKYYNLQIGNKHAIIIVCRYDGLGGERCRQLNKSHIKCRFIKSFGKNYFKYLQSVQPRFPDFNILLNRKIEKSWRDALYYVMITCALHTSNSNTLIIKYYTYCRHGGRKTPSSGKVSIWSALRPLIKVGVNWLLTKLWVRLASTTRVYSYTD